MSGNGIDQNETIRHRYLKTILMSHVGTRPLPNPISSREPVEDNVSGSGRIQSDFCLMDVNYQRIMNTSAYFSIHSSISRNLPVAVPAS